MSPTRVIEIRAIPDRMATSAPADLARLTGRAVAVDRAMNAEFLHLGVEGCRLQTKPVGGATRPADPPMCGFEGGDYGSALRICKRQYVRLLGRGMSMRARKNHDGFGFDDRALGEDDSSLDHVLQLADVAGPVVFLQTTDRGGRQDVDPFPPFRREMRDEVMRES